VPYFAAISISCRKSGTNWSLTLVHFPDMAPSIPCSGAMEFLSCSGRRPVSRGAAADVFDYQREFSPYRYCRKKATPRTRTLLIADELRDANFRAAHTFQSCQTNDTQRVGDFARCVGQVATRFIFPALVRCFAYIIFRAAPIPLYGVTV
jgi:hypothetical protein